jgi:hydrogenase expression/formation protein HypC
MCLGVPGKVIEIYESNGMKMGKVDFGGVVRETCLAYVPEIELGDYTLIHVGFAISQISEEEAQETLKLLQELGEFEAELGLQADGTDGS